MKDTFLATANNRHPPFLPPPPSQPPPALHSNPLLNALNEANKNARENEYQHIPDYEYIPVIPPPHLVDSSQNSSNPTQRPTTPPPITTLTASFRKNSNLQKQEESSANGINKFTSIEPVEVVNSNEKNAANIYYSFSNNDNNNNNNNNNLKPPLTHYRSPSEASATSISSLDNRFVNKINVVDPIETNSFPLSTANRTTRQIEDIKSDESRSSERKESKKTLLFIKNNNRNLTNVNNQVDEQRNKKTENSKINSHYEL